MPQGVLDSKVNVSTAPRTPSTRSIDSNFVGCQYLSRGCCRETAKCLHPACIPALLAGARAYTVLPGRSSLFMRLEKWSGWGGRITRLSTGIYEKSETPVRDNSAEVLLKSLISDYYLLGMVNGGYSLENCRFWSFCGEQRLNSYVMTSARFEIILLHMMIYENSETPVHA